MKTRSFILLVAAFLVMLGFVCGQKWTQYQNNKLENSMSLARPNGCITDMEYEEIHKYDGLAE